MPCASTHLAVIYHSSGGSVSNSSSETSSIVNGFPQRLSFRLVANLQLYITDANPISRPQVQGGAVLYPPAIYIGSRHRFLVSYNPLCAVPTQDGMISTHARGIAARTNIIVCMLPNTDIFLLKLVLGYFARDVQSDSHGWRLS
jgi:hypothetical protein